MYGNTKKNATIVDKINLIANELISHSKQMNGLPDLLRSCISFSTAVIETKKSELK